MDKLIEKYNIKNISKRLEAFLLVGALAFTSMGCGNKSKKETVSSETTTIEATTEDATSKYYNEIKTVEDNVVNFINDGLAKNLYDEDLTEDMKIDIARNWLDYYIMLNKENISGKSIEILNQDRDMNSIDMIRYSMNMEQAIQEQTMISKEDTVIDYKNLLTDVNDQNLVQELAGILASMHTAIDNKDDAKLNELTNRVIEIKNGLIQDNTEYMMIYNPMTLDLVLMLIDAADALSNGAVITSEEDQVQILNTSFVRCIEGNYVSNMSEEKVKELAVEFKIADAQNMTKEEILKAISEQNNNKTSEVSIRSDLRSISEASMSETLANTQAGSYDSEYSYKSVVENIANRIDLSLYKKYEGTQVIYDYIGGEDQIGKTTTTTVSPDEVPEDKKVPSTEESKTDDGKETTDVYLQAKTAGITNGSADAASIYRSSYAGKASSMPKKSVGSAPSLTSTNYNAVYTYWYNVTWNQSVNSFINAEKTATTEETYEPVTEEKTTEVPTTEEPTEEYIPVIDGEEEEVIIDEGTLTSQSLKAYRDKIYAEVLASYVDNYLYGQAEEENTKTM